MPANPIFTLHATDGEARRGELSLAHGKVQTPIFMPVGTVGSVKSLCPRDLKELGAEIILGNTYHLNLRPGMEVMEHFGGLHTFISWDRPILSDSGGFQIFSLSKLTKMEEAGATFRSHIDGSKMFLSPEKAVEIQETLGTDIHMVLDECTPYPATVPVARKSMELTLRWAKRCREARTRKELAQFAIVQGGVHHQLRQECAKRLVDMDFEGYAVGGLSVGEPKDDMMASTEACTAVLPADKPRYLMGVGTPLDIIEAVSRGIDMFDCVMPSRNARNGTLFTSQGRINIKNQQHRLSDEPLDPNCSCYTCQNFSRGYLRHLFMAKELSVLRYLTIHNLHYYLDLMKQIRSAIAAGTFLSLLNSHRNLWQSAK